MATVILAIALFCALAGGGVVLAMYMRLRRDHLECPPDPRMLVARLSMYLGTPVLLTQTRSAIWTARGADLEATGNTEIRAIIALGMLYDARRKKDGDNAP